MTSMIVAVVMLVASCSGRDVQRLVVKNERYTVGCDSVTEGDMKAFVRPDLTIETNYPSAQPVEASAKPKSAVSHKVRKSVGGLNNMNLDVDVQPNADFESQVPLVDALYINAKNNIEDLETQLNGVPADEAYTAISLSLAHVAPEVARQWLMRQVKDDLVMPDTVPAQVTNVSTLLWIDAAYQVYQVTGEKDWLRYVIKVASRTTRRCLENHLDKRTELYNGAIALRSGEVAPYPRWLNASMQYDTRSLRNNIIIYRALTLLDEMCDELDVRNTYADQATRLAEAINQRLWDEYRGCYSAYLYGPITPLKAPVSDAYAQALAILWNLASEGRAESIMLKTPFTFYGMPTFYPQPHHADNPKASIATPLLQALWTMAAAQLKNGTMLNCALGANVRMQAFAGGGDYGCDVGTGRLSGPLHQTLSTATSTIAMCHRSLLGMKFAPKGIEFRPVIPAYFVGETRLRGFMYRGSKLDIYVSGTGVEVDYMLIDGHLAEGSYFPAKEGNHQIVIKMKEGATLETAELNLHGSPRNLPPTPQVQWADDRLSIDNFNSVLGYRLVVNGTPTYSVSDTTYALSEAIQAPNLAVIASNKYGEGFESAPHLTHLLSLRPKLNAASMASQQHADGDSLAGGIAMQAALPLTLEASIEAPHAGFYWFNATYVCTGNPFIMTLSVQGHLQGTLLFAPTWGQEAAVTGCAYTLLKKGTNLITFTALPAPPFYASDINASILTIQVVEGRKINE